MLTIEVNADGELGLLPKLENNVKEASWDLRQSFILFNVFVDSS